MVEENKWKRNEEESEGNKGKRAKKYNAARDEKRGAITKGRQGKRR